MLKLLSSVSVVALLAVAPAAAQTTPPSTTPPAATQDKSSPSTTQDKSSPSTTSPSTAQDKSTTTPPSTAQDKSTTTSPSTAQDKSTTTPSTAQDKSTTTTPSTAQPGTMPSKQDQASVTLTEDQAKEWVDKPVFDSAGKEIGEVVEFKRSSDNKVTELHADLGGFLGMGESRVKLSPSEFKLQGDRVVLNLTEEQAKALPKVEK